MARKKLTLSTKANYGNWVPTNIMKMLGAADSVLAVLTFLFQRVFQLKPAAWVTGILCLIFCAYTFLYVALPGSFSISKRAISWGMCISFWWITSNGTEKASFSISAAAPER